MENARKQTILIKKFYLHFNVLYDNNPLIPSPTEKRENILPVC